MASRSSGFPSRVRGRQSRTRVRGTSRLLHIRLGRSVPSAPIARRGGSDDAGAKLGIDLVSIVRFRAVFDGKPALTESVFTPLELAYANAQRRPFEHLAARYAAKEAVLKALGTGFTSEMDWRDIETVRDAAGAPQIALSGAVARIAGARGLTRCAVSLTHSGAYALAVVLFEC